MVLEVGVQVLASQQARLAVVGTAHGHAAALGHVRGEGVGHELLVAVPAADESLGAVVGLVWAEVAALHLEPALVLAVQGLVPTAAHVALEPKDSKIQLVRRQMWPARGRQRSKTPSTDICPERCG